MTKSIYRLIAGLIVSTIIAVTIGILFAFEKYIVCFILSLPLCCLLYVIIIHYIKVLSKPQSFASVFQFSSSGISLNEALIKELCPKSVPEIQESVKKLNDEIQQRISNVDFFEKLVEATDTVIIMIDQAKKIIHINRAGIDLMTKPKFGQLSDLRYISPDLPPFLDKLRVNDVKTISYTKNGTLITLLVYSLVITKGNENIRTFMLRPIQSVLDEHETHAFEKLIRIQTDEITNVIASIYMLSESFSDSDTNLYDYSMINKAMQTIHKRSGKLVGMVNNYSAFLKEKVVILESFKMSDLLEDVVRTLYYKHIKFSYDVEPVGITLKADREQIKILLMHLIENAWEATENIDTGYIVVTVRKNKLQQTVISVKDNGIGVSETDIDHIFVPFFTTKKNHRGIGLSSCRQIVYAHGGTIKLRIANNGDTTFDIIL